MDRRVDRWMVGVVLCWAYSSMALSSWAFKSTVALRQVVASFCQ